MVILEDVQAELFSGALLSLQGPLATDCLAAHFNLRPTRSGFYYLKDKEALVLSSDRCGAVGWDICLPCTVEEALGLFPEEIPRVSPSVFRLISLETGNPVWGEDADSKTLPPELGEAFERSYISYQKGCYTGQEVLMRIHSQGHTNRTWMGLLAEEKMLPGWNLSHPSRTHIGSITSAGWSPLLGYVAAGYIRNEFARHGGEVVVQHEAGSFVAQIYQMPLLKLS
jgi:folate-binding protein YgfZ